MSQTTYANTFSGLFSGSVADTAPSRKGTWINGEGADIPAGIFVAFKSESGQYKSAELPDAEDDRIIGIVINSFARNPNDLSGIAAVKDGAVMNVMEEGAVMMATEQTIGPADPVFCRITSDGGDNTQLGKLRKDSDSGRAILVPGAHVLFGGTTSQAAAVYFSAAVNLSSSAVAQPEVADLTDNSGGAAADGTIAIVTAPTALTDNGGGTADGTVASQAAPVTLTDSTGLSGTHDDTLAATAAPTTLTDSTGLSGTHDDTLAVTTVPADLTGGESPTEAEHNAALAVIRVIAQNASDTGQKVIELVTLVGVMAQNDSDTAQKVIELVTLAATAHDNLKELTTAQAADRTAIVALTDAVKELSTKQNAVLAMLRTAGILQS
jgi:hypothetical protein